MAHQQCRALSALFLVVIAAGLNIYSASSTSAPTTNTPTPSNIVTSGRTESDDQTATSGASTKVNTVPGAAASATLSLRTTLGLTERNHITVPTITASTVDILATSPISTILNASTTNSSPQTSSGLRSTEHTVASVTSVARLTTDTTPPSETPANTPSHTTNVSSTIVASTDNTSLNTTVVTQLPTIKTSAVTVTTVQELSTEEATSKGTPVAPTSPGTTEGLTSSQVTSRASKATTEISRPDGTTFSAGVTIQEVSHALSSGSIAAITVTVIAVVLLVFGIAAFLKIRHSSYGRLFDDHDYGSWGNYNNPLYDDS